jgi:hypothetical protein
LGDQRRGGRRRRPGRLRLGHGTLSPLPI